MATVARDPATDGQAMTVWRGFLIDLPMRPVVPLAPLSVAGAADQVVPAPYARARYAQQNLFVVRRQGQRRLPGRNGGIELFFQVQMIAQFDQRIDLRADDRQRLLLQARDLAVVRLQLRHLVQDIQRAPVVTRINRRLGLDEQCLGALVTFLSSRARRRSAAMSSLARNCALTLARR
ncbi:MAG: hypothetical protein H6962_14460 [Chromatiaceae bacterium]|nr:hypothetical protein [Chromatiaceae bacterium]